MEAERNSFFLRILHVDLENERFEMEGNDNAKLTGRFSRECSPPPEDLRTWISEQELAQFVDDAVQQVRVEESAMDRSRAWDVLLGIVTYFYATGRYPSEEIEDSLWHSSRLEHVHPLVFGNAPAATVIRRFRRANRGAIEQCLAEVLRLASACRRSNGSRSKSLDYLREANTRVAHAIQFDSWALDV